MTALLDWATAHGIDTETPVICPNCGIERPAFAVVRHAPDFWGCDFCIQRMIRWAERDASARPSMTWTDLRAKRNKLLARSDKAVMPDSPVTNGEDWLTYRQALRDITATFEAPEDVVWPDEPEWQV